MKQLDIPTHLHVQYAVMETISASSVARLKRSLTLWDLILYGVIVIQPVAPMSVFGVLSSR
jgi:putrescine importer